MITVRQAAAMAIGGPLLVLAACSLNRSAQTRNTFALRDEVVTIAFDPSRNSLEFRLREEGGEVLALRANGVTLVLEEAGQPRMQRVPFASAQPSGSRLHLACAPVPDHEITVQVDLLHVGHCVVRVEDRIAARSLVREVRLDYAIELAPLDETYAPGLQPEGSSAIADEAFQVPLVFVRSGRHAVQLVPDLELLQRERPLPQALEFDIRRSPAQLSHGFVATRPASAGFAREDAPPAFARGEVFVFAHELTFAQSATPLLTLAEAIAALWHPAPPERDAPALAEIATQSRKHLSEYFASAARNGSYDPEAALQALLLVNGPGAILEPGAGLARAARGVAERFAETGDADAGALATALCEVALAAPRRAGLFPTGCLSAGAGTAPLWTFPGDAKERYHAFEIALVYRDLGLAAAALSTRPAAQDLRDRLDRNIAEAARFFTSNQLLSGAIPSWYESQYLVPEKRSIETAAETAGVALFLAELGARTGDRATLATARRALEFVRSEALGNHAWPEADSLHRAADVRGGQPFRRALPITCAVLAAVSLHEATGELAFVPLCDRLLDELAQLQTVWSPTWRTLATFGSVLTGNDSVATEPIVQSLAIEAFFAGFKISGRRQHLQRGIAALRWLAGPGPSQQKPRPFALDAARAASLDAVARKHGQVLVDLNRSFAESIDALTVEEFGGDAQGITIRLSTTNPNLSRARTTFVMRQPGATPGAVGGDVTTRIALNAEQIASGIDVPVALMPELKFQPPTEIAIQTPWYPRALVRGATSEPWSAVVEVRAPGRATANFELFPVPDQPWLVATKSFDPRGLAPGERIETRLVFSAGGRTVSEPRVGMRVVTLAEGQCIDPGEDDDHTLQGGGESEIRRADDGRENARAVHGTGSFTYRIQVPPESTQLHLLMRISGLASISSGTVELHRDSLESERELRVEEVVLADRRLWSNGDMALTFRSSDPRDPRGMALAKLRCRTEGNAVATPAAESIGASLRPRKVEPRCSLLVLPLALADRPLRADGEQLRQAFFGGPEYRMTPPPVPRRTAGSVAELVTAMSGARSLLEGKILPERATPLLAADIVEVPNCQQAILATLGGLEPLPSGVPDAIVVVVAGTPIRPELDGGFLEVRDAFPLAAKPLANVPILFLAERGSDGSFFASGHALAALIAARYGLPDMSRPEHGNFGELSLSSSKAGHLPSGIVGVNLARLGWCDQLTLPYENRSGLPLAALHDGRTFYELPIPFPNRGSVLVESRAGSRAEPGLTASGMLIYWQFPETGLEVVLANGKQIAPRFMRLSPVMPGFETPFHEALAMQDLFRTDCDLDELTSPSLATITGEGLWRIHRRSVAAGDKLAVEFAGQDLLKHGEIGFVRDGSTPVPGDSSGAEASAGLDSSVVTLAGAPAGGSSIGVIVAPSAARLGPCRLLAQFKVTTPPTNAEVEVRIGKRSLRCEIGTSQARTFWSELDADGFTPGERVTVTLGPSQGALARIRLEQLWLVPRAPVLATVTTDPANLRAQRLHDGNVYGSVFPMRETSPAQPRLRLPTLWPKGTSWLRLRIGAPWDGPALVTSKLSVRLLARNGTRNVALCSALPWRVDRKGAPLTTLLLQVPSSAQEGVAWLEFDVQGSALQVVSCEILRE